MSDPERLDHLRLARAEGVGPITYRRLLRRYGSAAAALDALPALARAGGRAAAPRVMSRARAERECEGLARLGAALLVLGDAAYPPLLALLEDAPPVVAVAGDPAALSAPGVALVGGRNASANGQKMAEALGRALAEAGFCVVSGLARGVDAAAHRGALAARAAAGAPAEGAPVLGSPAAGATMGATPRATVGATVAAIAGGLDRPYPPENAALQAAIAGSGGAVVAEAPLGTAPQARHFPRRNRIIAGLALGVVVVEAAHRSGSLITARMAQEAGRELFAVPGSPLDPRCHGSNDLIRQGAHLTETLADVLRNLPDHPFREGLARAPLFARGPPPTEPPREPPTGPHTGPPREPPGAPSGASAGQHPWLPPGMEEPRAAALVAPQAAAAEVGAARRAVGDLLGPTPTLVDDLIRHCQFSAAAVMAALLELELAGRVETLPGNRVALISGDGP